MTIVLEITLVLLTYLLGSIPFGYILTKKSTGKNIREFGSGNIGSTNVKRVAGKKIAFFTQLLDMLKGLLPVSTVIILSKYCEIQFHENFIFSVAFASILGHNFSIFLKFKGGKGVNTTLGASLLLAPEAVLISVAIYFIVKLVFKYVSLGSLSIAVSMPVVSMIFSQSNSTFIYLLICSILIILMHTDNIIRLIKGEENK